MPHDLGKREPVPYRLAADTFGAEELETGKAILDSGRLTMGEHVRVFEREFAAWTDAPHAVMVNSGSSANLLMVDAMLRRTSGDAPWRRGDEILVPALSWPTTVWPLVQLGLVPVFVDVDPGTLALDLASAESVLSAKTKGMFLIHVLGQTARMDEVQRFCHEHKLQLLEDSCESLGAHFAGRHAGTFGVMSSFSFYFSHHISSIEGGMIITDDRALADDLRSLRAHGWVRDRSDKPRWKERFPAFDERFLFISAGYNVRPMELQAGIAGVQLRKLDRMLDARERLAATVQGWIERSLPWLRLIGANRLGPRAEKTERRARAHSWMTLPFLVESAGPDTERVKAKLESMGVETRPIIAGNLSRHPATATLETRCARSLAQCDRILERGFMIGCHPLLAAGALETLERAFASLRDL